MVAEKTSSGCCGTKKSETKSSTAAKPKADAKKPAAKVAHAAKAKPKTAK